MTQLANHILIELAPLAGLLLVGAVIYATLRYTSTPSKAHLRSCDYIVWEAERINMANIEADLADHGWNLVDTRVTEAEALQCRFEKAGAASRCLSEIFDFERFLPRTSKPPVGTPTVIRIKEHGSRSSGDVHKYY